LPDSPLYGAKPLTVLLGESQFSKEDIFLLQYTRDLTKGVRPEDSPKLSPLPNSSRHTSSSTISQMIYAASTIYSGVFRIPSIPFASPHNTKAVETMSRCLEDTRNDETWTEFPGILLWIILVGLAAAVHQPQCSFFAMFAFRIGTSAAWWGPREAREAIMTFLDIKRKSEGRNTKRRRRNG
jgi:hypothetical protein